MARSYARGKGASLSGTEESAQLKLAKLGPVIATLYLPAPSSAWPCSADDADVMLKSWPSEVRSEELATMVNCSA